MDKLTEIRNFQALMHYSVMSGEDVTRELWAQQNILRSLNVSDGEINDLIHDRHGRTAEAVLQIVRQMPVLLSTLRRMTPPGAQVWREPRPPIPKSREELAEDYLQATGRESSPSRRNSGSK
jgi:hypothetical protein